MFCKLCLEGDVLVSVSL
jgi:hypothetical protein